MSEAELHWLHQRMYGGTLAKAQAGQLWFQLPVGLVHDPAGRIVLDPDEQVQSAVRLLFTLFDQLGSAMAVLRYFSQQGLRFPRRCWEHQRGGEVVWEPLQHGRILRVLHNPLYAGAYVFGRTRCPTPLPNRPAPRPKQRALVQRADWPIVRQEAHPGYITWEQFLHNQQILDANRTSQFEERPGATRAGTALLQGIALCGKCGRRMQVRYSPDGQTPGYECNVAHLHLGVNRCQSLRGDGVDAAVAAAFLEAIQPAQLEVSLATLEQLEAQAAQLERQWQLQRERAQYEVDLARRRFLAVDPENRLVARTLEREWNARLVEREELERAYTAHTQQLPRPVTAEERQQILALAQDVPALWHAPTTRPVERKRLLRLLIRDVTLTVQEQTIAIGIRWRSGAVSEVAIARPQRSCDKYRTEPQVVARVQELAAAHCDAQIAAILNAEGWRTRRGELFTDNKVNCLRYSRGIALRCPSKAPRASLRQRSDGRYTTPAVAEMLNVNRSTVAEWCRSGRLDAVRETPAGSYWVKLTEETIQELRHEAPRHLSRRARGQEDIAAGTKDAI